MTKPKMTTADVDGTPRCPHCSAELWNATVTMEALMTHFPVGSALSVGADGYAIEGENLTLDCGECRKPVAVGFNSDIEGWYDWQVKFVAARTKKDEEFINPDPIGRMFDRAIRVQSAVHCGVGTH